MFRIEPDWKIHVQNFAVPQNWDPKTTLFECSTFGNDVGTYKGPYALPKFYELWSKKTKIGPYLPTLHMFEMLILQAA